MNRRKAFVGNCPECKFATLNRGSTKTPRHGHIKSRWGWLPPCKGSGQEMIYMQEVKANNQPADPAKGA